MGYRWPLAAVCHWIRRKKNLLIAHGSKHPEIAASAWVAPDATVCGDVTIGPGTRILYGARLIGEGGGRIRIGANCIIMENAVIRGSQRHPCTIGDHCLIGPRAHVAGAVLEDQESLRRERRSFMEPISDKEQKCACTQRYICEPGWSQERPCRLAG